MIADSIWYLGTGVDGKSSRAAMSEEAGDPELLHPSGTRGAGQVCSMKCRHGCSRVAHGGAHVFVLPFGRRRRFRSPDPSLCSCGQAAVGVDPGRELLHADARHAVPLLPGLGSGGQLQTCTWHRGHHPRHSLPTCTRTVARQEPKRKGQWDLKWACMRKSWSQACLVLSKNPQVQIAFFAEADHVIISGSSVSHPCRLL